MWDVHKILYIAVNVSRDVKTCVQKKHIVCGTVNWQHMRSVLPVRTLYGRTNSWAKLAEFQEAY